eukprot:2835852-Amphidinium_carterae.1
MHYLERLWCNRDHHATETITDSLGWMHCSNHSSNLSRGYEALKLEGAHRLGRLDIDLTIPA